MGKRQLRSERETKKLIEAKKKAESAIRAKSEFLANVSHELRTPLNHITGFTELVVDQKFGKLNEIQKEYLNDVLQSSRYLLALINDLLDLKKVETGVLELEFSDINVNTLLESCLTMITEKALCNGLQVSMKMDGVPKKFRADRRKLKQVIYNLLTNAAKFTPDGGAVRVSAHWVDRKLQSGRRNGDAKGVWVTPNSEQTDMPAAMACKGYVEFAVADSGIGIKPADRERIFNRFEQVDGSPRKKYQGAGLGLSLSKSLVELHGGRIWAESEGEGKGSTFRFQIPVLPGKKGG
jgi:signal transduction histidine kinase